MTITNVSTGTRLGVYNQPTQITGDVTASQPDPSKLKATVQGTVAATQSGTWDIRNVTGTVTLPTGAASSALQSTANGFLQAAVALTPSVYDYISLGYTGADLTSVVYKMGGASGTVVSTLTLAYSGGALVSVTKT